MERDVPIATGITRRRSKKSATRQTSKAKGAPALALALVPQPRPPRNSRATHSLGLPRVRGQGAYDYRSNGRAIGADLGSMAGGALGGLVSQFLGRGAYTLRKNSLMSSSTTAPRFQRSTFDDGMVVSHREFVLDVIATGSTTWSITNSLSLNPGLQSVFTYVSQLGIAFEEYEMDQMVVVYEPTSGSVSTTQGLGSIQLATQYDLQDPPFGSQVEMLDYEFSTTCRPDMPMLHPIECDPRQNQLSRFYIRTGLLTGTTTNVDSRYNAYDIGRLSVAQTGVPAAAGVVLGKIFISYSIKFFKPKLGGGVSGGGLLFDRFQSTYTVTAGSVSGVAVGAVSAASSLGGTTSNQGTNVRYNFPSISQAGTYMVNAYIDTPSGSVGWTSFNVTNVMSTSNTSSPVDIFLTSNNVAQTFNAANTIASKFQTTLSAPNAYFQISTSSLTGLTGSGTYRLTIEVTPVYSAIS